MLKPLIVKGEADPIKKSCFDCYYCQGAVSWWCKNKDAVNYRGTQIPGTQNCSFWKAATHVRDVPNYDKYSDEALFKWIEVDCTEEG